jgi:hypothetical protein
VTEIKNDPGAGGAGILEDCCSSRTNGASYSPDASQTPNHAADRRCIDRSRDVKLSRNERSPISITVSPIKASPGRFQARLGSTGELLVGSSRQPFVDSARVLLEKGYDPNVTLQMVHAGSQVVALRARLGKAAKLSVEEGVNGPRFVAFRKDLKPCVDASPIPSDASPASLPPTKVRA